MERSFVWKTLQIVARIGTTLLFDLKVYDPQNVPATGGVLLVANHQSYLDPVLVAVKLRRPVSYFAKSELFENRFLGALIRKLHAFPVRQGDGDIGAVKETIRRLGEGHVLNIYPEGSRTETGELGPIEKGVALIVRRAHVPIVPVAIDGSYASWSKGRKMFRAHPIRLIFGKPFDAGEMKGDQIVKRIEHDLRELIAELRRRRELDRAGEPIAPSHTK